MPAAKAAALSPVSHASFAFQIISRKETLSSFTFSFRAQDPRSSRIVVVVLSSQQQRAGEWLDVKYRVRAQVLDPISAINI
jgi:hypothetical protein